MRYLSSVYEEILVEVIGFTSLPADGRTISIISIDDGTVTLEQSKGV